MTNVGETESELGVPIPGVILPPEQWAKTALKKLPPAGPLDWVALFGRQAPRVLDLGCGNGRFVLSSAIRRPEMDHLGLEILPVVIRYATRRANQRGLWNVRFAVCGGYEFLEGFVPPGTIAEIHVYHPQPYADVAKQARRLVTPAFLALVHRSLAPEGRFFIQTDSPDYWRYIAAIGPRFFDFQEQPGPWPDAPEGRTRREIMARQKGLTIYRAGGSPRPELGSEELRELVSELPLPAFAATRSRPKFGRPQRGRFRRSR
jgi:tRNA (guanine-N7-)-methyltransferase